MSTPIARRLLQAAAGAAALTLSTAAQAGFINTFDDPVTLAATQTPGAWYTDRYAPNGFATSGGTLMVHIDAADCATCRPPAYLDAFYNTQGRKYDIPGGTPSMSIQLYVDDTWAATGRRMAGFWGTAFDSSNAISAYPIIEFTSTSDGTGVPRFRGWDNGVWVDLGLPTGFVYDAWYTLEIGLESGNFVYKVGDVSAVVPGLGSEYIGNIILQAHNTTAGVSYDVFWDNLTVPEPAAIAMFALGLLGLGVLGRRGRTQGMAHA